MYLSAVGSVSLRRHWDGESPIRRPWKWRQYDRAKVEDMVKEQWFLEAIQDELDPFLVAGWSLLLKT